MERDTFSTPLQEWPTQVHVAGENGKKEPRVRKGRHVFVKV